MSVNKIDVLQKNNINKKAKNTGAPIGFQYFYYNMILYWSINFLSCL